MTVENDTAKIVAEGNGSSTVFSFSPMVILDKDDLLVVKTDTAGVETTLTRGTGTAQYTVNVASFPGTGSITYPSSGSTRLQNDETITIKRVVDMTQEVDLENQGGYFPDVQETALDKLTMLHLQQQEEIDRTLKGSISDPADIDMTLPVVGTRANKIMAFNSDGEPTIFSGTLPEATLSVFGGDLIDDETATEALTTLSPSGEFVLYNPDADADDETVINVRFQGEDDGGNVTTYGRIRCQIADNTDGTEDARLRFLIPVAGTEAEVFKLGPGHSVTVLSDDAGASAGPTLVLDRDSASPNDSDNLGQIKFSGRDDGAASVDYFKIKAKALDVTDGTEDGGGEVFAQVGGSETKLMDIGPGVAFGAANGGVPGTAGHVNAVALFDDNVQVHSLAAGLESHVATTSGTSHEFTGIRSDARRITIMFRGVSTDGTNLINVQLGTSASYETSDYLGAVARVEGATTASSALSSAFAASGTMSSAGNGINGSMILTLENSSSNRWVAQSVTGEQSSGRVHWCGGSKTLADVLTRIRVTSASTFDNGEINILVE